MTLSNETRWDECTECGETLYLGDRHTDYNFADEFEYECPDCGAKLSVTVHMLAEFEVEKKKEPE